MYFYCALAKPLDYPLPASLPPSLIEIVDRFPLLSTDRIRINIDEKAGGQTTTSKWPQEKFPSTTNKGGSLLPPAARARQRSIGSSLGCIPLSLSQVGPPRAIHHNIGLFVPAFTSITHSTSSAAAFCSICAVLCDVTRKSERASGGGPQCFCSWQAGPPTSE